MFKDQFAKQSHQNKAEYVKRNGTFLLGRLGKLYMYNLYYVHDFYVEIAWDIRDSKLVGVDTFRDSSRLDSYIKRIQLNELRENFD